MSTTPTIEFETIHNYAETRATQLDTATTDFATILADYEKTKQQYQQVQAFGQLIKSLNRAPFNGGSSQGGGFVSNSFMEVETGGVDPMPQPNRSQHITFHGALEARQPGPCSPPRRQLPGKKPLWYPYATAGQWGLLDVCCRHSRARGPRQVHPGQSAHGD